MSQRAVLTALALGLAITALFWVDPIFIPLALLGPLLTGALAAICGLPLAWQAGRRARPVGDRANRLEVLTTDVATG